MGPVLLLDKSAIHSLSERESYWLDNLYFINRVPPLFMEVMADLKKKPSNLQLSADQVQALANKFPIMGVYQNTHHEECWQGDLLGYPVPMDGRIPMPYGNEIIDSRGESGILFDRSPEDKAMDRWKRGEFNEFENELADRWRESLKGIDLTAPSRAYAKMRRRGEEGIQSLEELVHVVRDICEGKTGKYVLLKEVVTTLVPNNKKFLKQVYSRWSSCGRPEIFQYAPYAMHCFAVKTFFTMGLALNLISTRASNVIDLQYLYYLPFCSAFTSGDKFHKQLAPLFMRKDQLFLNPEALKSDLKRIADDWDKKGEKSKGTASFITKPWPGMISEKVWDHCFGTSDWRYHTNTPRTLVSEEEQAKSYERMKPVIDAVSEFSDKRRGKPLNEWDAALNPSPKDHI
tara:strand:+ start:2500 stop:3705 length:1206 start_codon:yes stop_codon:yes gene_type:complete